MGLDISVYKIKKKTPEEVNDGNERFFRLTNDNAEYHNPHPEWTKEFEVDYVQSYYDWEKFKEETGIDVNEYNWAGECYDEKGCFMYLNPKDMDKDDQDYEGLGKIKIDLEKVPLKEKSIKVLPIEEVGYQRKGLNGKFYDDYESGKIGYFVWTKAELERYKEEYCDEPYEYVYPNGEKSGNMVYPKLDFQRHIIDHFTEGEDCVTFDW